MWPGNRTQTESSNPIQKSRKYYESDDIALCTCTPPIEICLWGCICPIALRNFTRTKIDLLENAAAAGPKSQSKAIEELKEFQDKSYCGNGMTFNALQQITVTQALDSLGSSSGFSAGAAAADTYRTSFVLRMRNWLRNDNAGSCETCLETAFCRCCVNCNNAYAVNEAVKRYLPSEEKNQNAIQNKQPQPIQSTDHSDRQTLLF